MTRAIPSYIDAHQVASYLTRYSATALYCCFDFTVPEQRQELRGRREETRSTNKNKNVSKRDQDWYHTLTLTSLVTEAAALLLQLTTAVLRSHISRYSEVTLSGKYLLQACIMQNSSVCVTAKWLFCAATSPLACQSSVSLTLRIA
ncbi:hypothetical protein F4776DRAFT_605578 [Hypoxylon sp. NC0597]|nr:hypothetical protein F4776DRAFT_605578 [Hypoxylon sp. NC0597]